MRGLLWASFLVAVVLTVLIKLLQWMHNENPQYVTFKASLENYFVGSTSTKITSISVVGFELLLGAVYVDHLPIFGEWLANLPPHPALAFFLGSLAEGLAPLGIGWISKKIFP